MSPERRPLRLTAAYRFVAADADIFSSGHAALMGSEGGKPVNAPIAGTGCRATEPR